MVNVNLPDVEFNQTRLDQYYNTTKVGTLDVLGATLDETFYYNPTNALDRMFQLKMGKGTTGNLLSPEEYKESQYYRKGFELPPEGIKEGYAQLLADNYDKRQAIQQTLSRSKGGFGLGAAQFGTMLLGSVLDPLNVASAFVPVFPGARFAHLVAKYGKTKARAIKGVVEGTVGAGIVEPLPLGAAALEQDENYGLFDSFLNVTVGGVLGGGLHVGFGKISDIIERRSAKTKEQALVTAIKQVASDQEVEVTPIMKADLEKTFAENLKKQNELSAEKPTKLEDVKRTGKKKIPDIININKAKKPKTLLQFIKENGKINSTDPLAGDVAQALGGNQNKQGKFILDVKNAKGAIAKKGIGIDEMTTRVQEAGYFLDKSDMDYGIDAATPDDLIALIRREQDGEILYSRSQEAEYENYIKTERMAQEIDELGIDPTNMTDAELQQAVDIQLRERANIDDTAISETPEMRSANTPQEITNLKEQQIINDFNIGNLREYEEYVRMNAGIDDNFNLRTRENEIDFEIEELERELENTSAVVGDEELEIFNANIKNADDLIEKVNDSYETATETARQCIIRNSK